MSCNAINPGWVATDSNYSACQQEIAIAGLDITVEEYRARVAEGLPQKRFLDPDEVAALAAFLCRDEAFGIDAEDHHHRNGVAMVGTRHPELAFWLETPSIAGLRDRRPCSAIGSSVLDMEHGVIGPEACDADRRPLPGGSGSPCYVRVAAAERLLIQHALDYGADGVMLPQIADAAHAARGLCLRQISATRHPRRRLQPDHEIRRL